MRKNSRIFTGGPGKKEIFATGVNQDCLGTPLVSQIVTELLFSFITQAGSEYKANGQAVDNDISMWWFFLFT